MQSSGERLIGQLTMRHSLAQGVNANSSGKRQTCVCVNLRVVGMDVTEIQIDSTSDWTRHTTRTNAATARHLVGNKRPNKGHVSNASCLTS